MGPFLALSPSIAQEQIWGIPLPSVTHLPPPTPGIQICPSPVSTLRETVSQFHCPLVIWNFQLFFPFRLERWRTNTPAGRFQCSHWRLHEVPLLKFKFRWILSRGSIIAESSLRASSTPGQTSQPVVVGLGWTFLLQWETGNWCPASDTDCFLSSYKHIASSEILFCPLKPVSVTRVTGQSADAFCLQIENCVSKRSR